MHPPLPISTPSIRLITLRASQDTTSPLVCTLSAVDLDAHPRYDALSYVWGDPERAELAPILTIIDATCTTGSWTLNITPNLSRALRRLRHQVEPRSLWVDAICINQNDAAEKNRQIPLMARIYRQAETVVAWLGDGGPDEMKGVDAVGPLSEDWTSCVERGQTTLTDWARTSYSISIMSLVRLEYFERIWVVQEIGMSGKRAILQYGSRTASWDDFMRAVGMAIKCRAGVEAPVTANRPVMMDWARGFEASTINEEPIPPRKELLKVLLRYRPLHATDPRDKVFAMLNLVEDDDVLGDPRVAPNYNLGAERVYLNLAHALLERSGNLDILRVPRGEGPRRSLPSWVPDWSICDETMSLTSSSTYLGSHLKFVPQDTPYVVLSPDGRQLTVRGAILSLEITSIGPCLERSAQSEKTENFWKRTRNQVGTILQWEDIAKAQPCNLLRVYTPPRVITGGNNQPEAVTVGEAFRKTLLFGKDYDYTAKDGYTAQEDFDIWHKSLAIYRGLRGMGVLSLDATFAPLAVAIGLKTTLSSIAGTAQPRGDAATFGDELALAASGRKFFSVDNRLFGMGPAGLQHGDRIALIQGVGVLLVLRQSGQGSGTALCNWEVVGDCYIHSKDLAEGQMWNEEDVSLITLV